MRCGSPITSCLAAAFPAVIIVAGALVGFVSLSALTSRPARGGELDPRQTPPNQPLVEGKQVFDAKGCAGCHSVRGGTTAPRSGPDLGRQQSWGDVMQFAGSLWNHTPAMSAKMREQGMSRPTVSPEEMGKLVPYLFAARFLDEPGDATRGRELFVQRSCAECHQLAGRGGTVGPRLDELKDYVSSSFMTQALWNHGPDMATKMAERKIVRPRLEDDDVAHIVAYIRGDAQGASALDLAYAQAGSPQAGKAVFQQKGCTHCHAIAGTGGTVGPDLGSLRPRAHVAEMAAALWNHGPPMWARMKALGIPFPKLTDAEMADLLAYLYFVQYMGHSGDAARGAQVFRDKSCSGCHAVRGEGQNGAADLSASSAVRSPFHWTAAMWNHTSGVEKKEDGQQPAWPRFDDDQMRDLVEFLRSPGAAK